MAYGGARGGCLGSGYGMSAMFMNMNATVAGGYGYLLGQGAVSLFDAGFRDWQENVESKSAEKEKAKQAVKDDVDNLKTKNDEYNKLASKSDKDIEDETLKANPSLKENVDKAEAKISDIDAGKDSNSAQIKALNNKNDELKKQKASATEQKDKDEIDKQIETNNEEIRKLNAEKEKARALAVKEKEDATTARSEAIEKAQKAHKQAVNDKKEELKTAQKQTEEDVSKVHQISKKCDDNDELKGIILKEGSNKEVTGELSSDDINDVSKDNAKKYARAFNYQFGQYCSEKDSDKKKTMAANAKLVYDKLKGYEEESDKKGKYITPEMEQNMKIMQSGQKTFGL